MRLNTDILLTFEIISCTAREYLTMRIFRAVRWRVSCEQAFVLPESQLSTIQQIASSGGRQCQIPPHLRSLSVFVQKILSRCRHREWKLLVFSDALEEPHCYRRSEAMLREQRPVCQYLS